MFSRPRSFAVALLAMALAVPAGGAFGQSPNSYQAPGTYQEPGNSYQGSAPPPSGPVSRPKPKGGCLKYGAAGAVGGHFAHHHAILGAVGGCAVGMYVKHRSKKNIRATGQP